MFPVIVFENCTVLKNHCGFSPRRLLPFIVSVGLWAVTPLLASSIYLPNASFEEPSTPFVETNVVGWQKSPQPTWYNAAANGPWDQLAGIFLNTPSTNGDHLANCDGTQAAFLFALPGVALFEETGVGPGLFQVGRSYNLTVGVLGNGGGMSNGATLELSFYYRDSSNQLTVIASSIVTNSSTLFPDRNHLVDFSVRLPGVAPTDPWAGKPIGVLLVSTVDFSLIGGYWDLDNVRISESIAVPNFSFESPSTPFVDTNIDSWAKSPKPIWYDENANGPWSQLSGVFMNPPADSTNSDHLVNCDGTQAAFLFALPTVALWQDNLTSTNAFNVSYVPGQSYQLTVGVLGNGGGMTNGATLEVGLYYLDAGSNMVSIGATTITNSTSLFPTHTNLVDFKVQLPPVRTTDPWAGKNVGIRIASTVDFALAGGYWDIDNIRLASTQAPILSGQTSTNGFELVVLGEPGQRLEILSSSNVGASLSNWISLALLTNVTGRSTFTDTNGTVQRFYQARQAP